MGVLSTVLFFIYTLGFGLSLTYWWKTGDFFERNLMRIGIGIGMIPVFGLLLNLLHLPIDWKLFLVGSLIGPAVIGYRKVKKKEKLFDVDFKLTKSRVYLIAALLLFAFTLFMYLSGAFSYPWLGDGDPWVAATGIKYITVEKTAYVPAAATDHFRYIDPYPPGYAIFMSLFYQTADKLISTMKFFNALIISLSILFFYLFAKAFTRNRKLALIATFILTMIPSYLSRFIWAHSLVIILIFPLFYALLQASKDQKWLLTSSVMFGAIWVSQAVTQPVKISVLLFLFCGAKAFTDKKYVKYFLVTLIGGLIISLVWWGPYIAVNKEDSFSRILGKRSTLADVDERIQGRYFGEVGSATRLYTFNDFFVAKKVNMINQPVGWGVVLTLLIALGLVVMLLQGRKLLQKKYDWQLISLLWFGFTFAGLYGGTVFPVALFSFRFWHLVAIAVAFVGAVGFIALSQLGEKFKFPQWVIILILVVGVFFTSGIQKYQFNTTQWSPEQSHVQYGQLDAYLWLDTLPKGTNFLYMCHDVKWGDHTVHAFDLDACPWCNDELSFREQSVNQSGWAITAEDVAAFMDEKGYQYFMLDGNCIRYMRIWWVTHGFEKNDTLAAEEVQRLINDITDSESFIPVHTTQGSVIWQRA